MSPKMDPSLKEKQAFFEQLDACRDFDDESDVLSTKEEILRQKCKAFSLAAAATAAASVSVSVSVSVSSSSRRKLLGSHHRRIASDPIPKPANDELEIIAVIPRDNSARATASASVYSSSTGNSIIPEANRLTASVLRSQSDLELSSSISMPKRKRNEPLKMVPESKQIFNGLFFFYIPNDDLNPARRMRITKAREHGAIWTQDSKIATHVIVDAGLEYHHIKPILDRNPTSPSVVLVNDRYPVDCWIRGVLIDPYQTVERRKYKVPEDPGSTRERTAPQALTQESNSSLQIKPRKGARRAPTSTPHSPQRSGDLIPSSYPEVIQSSGPNAETPGGTNLQSKSVPCDTANTLTFTDELATCIDAVLDDPESHEYLDDSDRDAQVSEDEGPPKKKGKGRLRPQRNDANAKFGEDKFMCMRGGTRDKKISGPNADIIKLFEEMAEEHRLSDETWRVQSYRKAVATLRRQPKKITTAKEAKALPNIGGSLADHIEEIATTGRFKKLDNIRNEPSRAALKIFCNVYGVGVPTAKRWVELGYRTLDDLRTKASLTTNQQLGLDHYDDLLTRIPRAEVKALGDLVKDVAAVIDPNVELIIGGSYRRGAETSGDIDLIITKNGTSSTQDLVPFLDALVDTLTEIGFLTAALASHRHDGGNKWHGCCVLPAVAFPGPVKEKEYRPIWRRVDFLIVPETEIGAALVYFTGNDLFNRSMRLLARKKKMRLNHRALSGVGVHEGRDEKKIFEILGVQWREPHERWC
ncbi:hypothetical protein F4859DRAFT_489624 [Xylaria cf. heliscus]|nr:hypothetical protein F4859DRAFT_489624 [Xylaria cf. heliscus]